MDEKGKSGGKRRSGTKRSHDGKKVSPESSKKVRTAEEVNDDDNLFLLEDEEGGTRVGGIFIPPPVKPYCSTESKGPRLIITRIENHDFKSYAGTVTLGPFHHRFSAIIGPNGSGKSNVIDSMLFVFGYRAQKLRCPKLSTLLHNSAKFPNRPSCKVAIYFKQILDKNEDEYESIPGSEFVIARTAFKDNSSFYTINDRKCTIKDVMKLLKSHGIDLDHNRFLILQGEVESISLMKPVAQNDKECGMVEYLEDIIGTSRYKQPLQQLNELVDQLTEERREKINRCKLVERDMNDLEQPYKEAIEFLKQERELVKHRNLCIQKYLSELNKQIIESENYLKETENKLKEHDEEASKLVAEREEKQKYIRESNEILSKLSKTHEDLEQKQTKAANNFEETQNTMVATNKRRKQNQEQIKKLENKLEELKKIPEKNQNEIEDCEKKITKLDTEKQNLEESLQKNYQIVEDQTRPLVTKREQLQSDLIEKKKISDEAKSQLELKQQELKILQSNEVAEYRKYESLKSSLEETKSGIQEKQQKLDQCQIEIPKIKNEISVKTATIVKKKQEEEKLYNKVLEYRNEILEKKAVMQAAKTNNRVLDSIMKQKYEGKIPGVLGRLGDLGGIDPKYDVAISTACRCIDFIVVDTVDTAQACIEHLKKYDIGRGSFIALEKVKHFEQYCHQKEKYPENVPRLFDLIQVEDERVLPAFYYGIRNTLVAVDLNQGTRIAYGPTRYRVVTLRGDIIETSGTMSGGGRTQIRGKMGQKVRTQTKGRQSDIGSAKELERLEIAAEEIQNQVNNLQHEQSQLDNEIKRLKAQLNTFEKDEKYLRSDLRSLTEHLPQLEENLRLQKKRADETKSDKHKVEQLQEEINEKQQIFNETNKTTTKLTEKIAKISKEIESVYGDKIKTVQQQIDAKTKQIKKLNENVSKLKVEITTSERNLKKTEKQIEDCKEEIKSAEENLITLKEKRESYQKESEELIQQIENIKKEIEVARESTKDIVKEIAKIQAKEEKLKLKRVEIEENLKEAKNKLADKKSSVQPTKNRLKALKLNEIPGERRPPGTEPEQLKTYTEEELETYNLQEVQYQESQIKEKLKTMKPNLSAIQDYYSKRAAYEERIYLVDEISRQRNEARLALEEVRKKRYLEFTNNFSIITKKLKEMYQMITQGGDAELELIDTMSPFTEGVSFTVRPPKKTWKNISNLSGGEKTLASLALVFALHYFKPSPLYFMDEIDAALDFKNVSIVANYIREKTKNAQFIIISLRSNMFELADHLVGIYKIKDCTDSVTVKNIDLLNELRLINYNNNNAEDKLLNKIRTLISNINGAEDVTGIEKVLEKQSKDGEQHLQLVEQLKARLVQIRHDEQQQALESSALCEN